MTEAIERLGEKGLVLVAPVDLNKKVLRTGRARFKRSLPRLSRVDYRHGVPARGQLKGGYNDDDVKVAREFVEQYCPVSVPKRLKGSFRGWMDLFEALLIYVLVVEFGWPRAGIEGPMGRSRKVQSAHIAVIETARDSHDFIERICARAEDYRNGLL